MPLQYISDLSGFQKGENVLVITGCSKQKMETENPVPARELYRGQLFQFVKEFADEMGYPLAIISAKYGFIRDDTLLVPYDKVLKTNADADALKPQVEAELGKVLLRYDKILVIAGEKYRRTLEGVADGRFYFLKTKGIGYTLHVLKERIPELNFIDSY